MKTIMKVIKWLAIIFGLFVLFCALLFIAYWTNNSQPTPSPSVFFGTESYNKLTGHNYDADQWKFVDGRMEFINGTSVKGRVKLCSDDLPSEKKKKGYITTKVTMTGNFNELPKEAIFGFQIGNKNAPDDKQLIIGVNGDGEIATLTGNLTALTKEKLFCRSKLIKTEDFYDKIDLNLHYYRNPYGWVLFFSAKDKNKKFRAAGGFLNYIPYEKLSSGEKEISLIAFNPTDSGKIWFKDWEIYNDWTPND